MRKYKLIKWYPGLPENWRNISVIEVLWKDNRYDTEPIGSLKQIFFFDKNEIENNPEYWQEIKERQWEIVEVTRNDQTKSCVDEETIERYLRTLKRGPNLHWHISKVKRLSDGEIFTIGDNVECVGSHQSGASKITSIELNKEENIILKTVFFHINGVSINKAKKIEEEKCWFMVDTSNWRTYESRRIGVNSALFVSQNNFKGFVTEKERDEYIKRNAPVEKFAIDTLSNWSLFSFMQSPSYAGTVSLGVKVFDTEQNREQYIQNHKPQYSQSDLLSFGKYCNNWRAGESIVGMLTEWRKQKK